MEILRKFRHAILKSEVTPLGCGSREDLQRIHGIGGRLESQSDRRQFRGAALAIRGIIPGSIMAKSKARPSEWLAETETNRRATYIIFTQKQSRGKPQGENYERQHTAATNDFASEFAANNLHKSIFNHPKRGSYAAPSPRHLPNKLPTCQRQSNQSARSIANDPAAKDRGCGKGNL